MQAFKFFNEDVEFELSHSQAIRSWLNKCAHAEDLELDEINVIFCSDEFLLDLNRQYLEHDYYTDILTFDYTNEEGVNGDLYISIDRVTENAATENVSFLEELCRVMVHGLLHIAGYKDKQAEELAKMRDAEDKYLSFIKHIF